MVIRFAPDRGVHVKFQMKKTSNGQFRFNIVASNGQIVATSETYTRKQSALDTIESIKKNAPAASVDDQTTA
jgi:uncharacterized protein YegP (UPF0339 family)